MKKVTNIVLNDFTNDSRVLKTATSLSVAGYNVTVVALHSNGLCEKEVIHGVNVERILLKTRTWPKIRLIQLIKYFEFILKAFFRYRKGELIHCNDLEALPIGLLIKLFGKNVFVVYDAHEYETETHGLYGLEKKAKKIIERFMIRFVDKVITVSESIANEYSRIYNIEKPYLVLNTPFYKNQAKKNIFRAELGIRSDQTIFIYQGGLGKGRGIEVLINTFDNFKSDENVIVFMGYGLLENYIKKKADFSDNIFFYQAVSPAVLLDYTSSADYGFLSYQDNCLNHRYCSPNKIFEYLMAGIPVLTSNLVEMKRLVENYGVGIVADENTVEAFSKAVHESLKQDYSSLVERVHAAREIFCWEEQEKVLLNIYRSLS